MQDVEHFDVLIIGGGLTGLALAYYLKSTDLKVKIIEARNRLGGRIYTLYPPQGPSQEMGATWLGKKHRALIDLLDELNLGYFKQELGETAIYEPISTSPHQIVQLPPNSDPSFRIIGGSSKLIQTLAAQLGPDQIALGQVVQAISQEEDQIRVSCESTNWTASKVVSTLPPNLLVQGVVFDPALPPGFVKVAQKTHTWMGESIKVSFSYATPFWKDRPLSGTIVSNVGPIPEMYDHSNEEGNRFALKGFLNGAYFSLSKEERLAMALAQLEKYYGAQVRDFLDYQEVVWRNESHTFVEYKEHVLPHQNGGHAQYQNALWDQQLIVAGSETARQFPGYMDGAVESAKNVKQLLLDMF